MSKRVANRKRKAVENTAMAAKKARGETDLPDGLSWTEVGEAVSGVKPLLLLSSDTLPGCSKAAGFDIDWTLISTKSGRKFATGAKDWEWWNECVPDKLRSLHEDGYRVIFFTNQAGIEKNKVKPREIMDKVEAMIDALQIPVIAFVSTATSHFRKPSSRMWDHFVQHCNQGVKPDVSECIYVGDAAGRAKEWQPGKPRDFSSSDRMFAANIGCKFATPEEFFLDESAAPFKWGSIDPVAFLETAPKRALVTYHSGSQEMILMVGPPASGKSTFRKTYLEPNGYVAVNRDTLKTPAKCLKAAQEALADGSSVVIDNTNPSEAGRADYINLAKKTGVPCRCFVMDTPLDLAHHLNLMRMTQTNGETRRVPDVGYAVYKKNFKTPCTTEGFTEVKTIPFTPNFTGKKDEELFKQWTV